MALDPNRNPRPMPPEGPGPKGVPVPGAAPPAEAPGGFFHGMGALSHDAGPAAEPAVAGSTDAHYKGVADAPPNPAPGPVAAPTKGAPADAGAHDEAAPAAPQSGGLDAQGHHDSAHAMLQQAHAMAPDLRSKQLLNRVGQHVTHLHKLATGGQDEPQQNASTAAAMEHGGNY